MGLHKKSYIKNGTLMTDQEVRQTMLSILDAVDNFCTRNGISYSLSSGSLIGAVRHKGIIPWDDDIDILMQRKDYERFLATFNGNYKNLETVDYISEPDYSLPFAKVMDMGTQIITGGNRLFCYGVFIDIFPVDGHPGAAGTAEFYKKFMHLYRHLHKSCKLYRYSSNPFTCIKFFTRCLFNRHNRETAREMEALLAAYPFESSEYAGEATADRYMEAVLPKNVFTSFKRMEFEKRKISCLVEYDTYLTAYYNEYMKFPPVEEQKPLHKIKAYKLG